MMKLERTALATLIMLASSSVIADGIVSSVVKAPITPDGDVAGAPADFVIDLDTSLDPASIGRPLPSGCSVRVTLPDDFENTGLPVQDPFTMGCAPGNFQCITGIFLQGWPQHPILPASGYELTLDGTHTLVFTSFADISAPNLAAAPGPGLKQVHVINGFVNPKRPGFYPIHVEFSDGPGCTAESGVANLHIVPKIRPSVEVTSVFNPGSPNTIYQETTPGNPTPFAWDFLLWDRKGDPMVGVSVEMVNPDFALLKQGKRAVGHIRIQSPPGAAGQSVSGGPSFEINGPVKGVPTARLTVRFTAGSTSGRYVAEVALHGGNSLRMFVDVL